VIGNGSQCASATANDASALLLDHHHAALDAAGTPAYLKAATWQLTRFYQKRGYQRGAPFHLRDHGPACWPMLRWSGSSAG